MKNLFLTLLLIFPLFAFSQEACVKIDSVYSTSKAKDLNRRDIKFGVKQIVEDAISEKYCLSDKGESVKVDIYYFGTPKTTIRIVGVEQTKNMTQVGIKIYYNGATYQGIGESEVEVRAVMIELVEGKVPFSKMTVSNALKKAIEECVSKMPG
jgi:hypothetical protein